MRRRASSGRTGCPERGSRSAARADGARASPGRRGLVRAQRQRCPLASRGVGGKLTFFEGDQAGFEQLGFNVSVLGPGDPMSMYHWENEQEDFLILSGEAVLVVEGQGRQLRAWDLVHCPARTKHVIVGAGSGPCVIVSVGTRLAGEDWGAYTVDPTAAKHNASVEEETTDPGVAYARFPERQTIAYEEGWLAD